jgi:hypothetical protein
MSPAWWPQKYNRHAHLFLPGAAEASTWRSGRPSPLPAPAPLWAPPPPPLRGGRPLSPNPTCNNWWVVFRWRVARTLPLRKKQDTLYEPILSVEQAVCRSNSCAHFQPGTCVTLCWSACLDRLSVKTLTYSREMMETRCWAHTHTRTHAYTHIHRQHTHARTRIRMHTYIRTYITYTLTHTLEQTCIQHYHTDSHTYIRT